MIVDKCWECGRDQWDYASCNRTNCVKSQLSRASLTITQTSKPCFVKGCGNSSDRGNGYDISTGTWICSPCYRMLYAGKMNPSEAWFVTTIQELVKKLESKQEEDNNYEWFYK